MSVAWDKDTPGWPFDEMETVEASIRRSRDATQEMLAWVDEHFPEDKPVRPLKTAWKQYQDRGDQ